MGKKNVHKLSSDTDLSFSILGISSHENDYRISWALNEQLGFKFRKGDNHSYFHPKFKETLVFTQYSFEDAEHAQTFRLISNRCDNGFLLDEYKNIDFLLLTDLVDTSQLTHLQAEIRKIPFVSAVFPINFPSLKNKNRLF